jgi:AraC-like DNA-binding protein
MSQPELDPCLPKERAEFLRFGQFDWLHATFVQHSFVPHTHDAYVFSLIERGVEAFTYQKTVHHAPAGSLVMVNPHEVHTGYAPLETGWTYRSIYPKLELMQQIGRQLGVSGIPVFGQAVLRDVALERQFLQMHQVQQTNGALAAESMLLEVLAGFIARHAQTRVSAPVVRQESGAVAKARRFLEDNLAHNTRLQELAVVADLSEFTLLKAFRRAHGLPPHAYLTQRRLEGAKTALRGGLDIASIAADFGFADQAHLTRAFKKTYGITPSVYRKGIGNFIQDTPPSAG